MSKMIYSFSRLSLYTDCPYRFYLRYIEKREEIITEPLALGKAVHKAIELMLNGSDLNDALLDAEMESEVPIHSEELRNLVKKAPIRKGEGLENGTEIEKYFKLPLSNTEQAPYFQGYIDVVRNVFGCFEFVDWKTNRVKYSPMDTMQLPLYAWALSEIYDANEVTGILFFLRYFKKAQERMSFNKAAMEKARAWAERTANEIEDKLFLLEIGQSPEELFPLVPNPHCKYCSFAAECLLKNEQKILGGFIA